MPIYSVTQKGSKKLPRMVEATKPAEALNHVIADTFVVERVDGRDLIELSKAGVELEMAGESGGDMKESDKPTVEKQEPSEDDRPIAPIPDPDHQREDRDENRELEKENPILDSGFDNKPIDWEGRENAD